MKGARGEETGACGQEESSVIAGLNERLSESSRFEHVRQLLSE